MSSLNRSAGPVRHKSCLVLAVLPRDAFCRRFVSSEQPLAMAAAQKLLQRKGGQLEPLKSPYERLAQPFVEKLHQLFLFQVNDYNNNGLNHLDVNVHSGFQFLSILIIDGCWLASQALLRYYARAALLQVQARRVTAKDHLQFPKRAVVIGSGVKVGIAGRWTVFNFNSHIRWKFDALKKLYFLHI